MCHLDWDGCAEVSPAALWQHAPFVDAGRIDGDHLMLSMSRALPPVQSLHATTVAVTRYVPAVFPDVSLENQIVAPDYYGDIELRGLIASVPGRFPTTVSQRFEGAQAFSLGASIVMMPARSTSVCIPKSLINEVATHCTFSNRDAHTFRSFSASLRLNLTPHNIPAADARLVMTYALPMGFCVGVPDEIASMDMFLKPHENTFELLAEYLRFEFPARLDIRVLPMRYPWLVAFFLGIFLALYLIFAPPPPLLSMWEYTRYVDSTYEAVGTLASVATGLYQRRIAPVITTTTGTLRAILSTTHKDPGPVDKTCKYRLPNATRPLLNKHEVGLYGYGFSSHMPIVFDANLHNETIAIVNRQSMPTTHDATTVARFRAFALHNMDTLLPGWRKQAPLQPVTFDDWNRRFPSAVQRIHLEARDRLRSETYSRRHLFQRGGFVKREKGKNATPAGGTDAEPRLISSSSPELNVLLGPWTLAFSKYLARVWGPDHFITYSAGLSAEQHGDIVTNRQPGTTPVEDDCSRWDATIHDALLDIEYVIMKRLGADRHYPEGQPYSVFDLYMRSKRVFGKTRCGVRWTSVGRRQSGMPDTSCGNSLLNGFLHTWAYCETYGVDVAHIASREHPFYMLVLGDDNLGQWSLVDRSSDVADLLRQAGLKPKMVVREDLDTATYCSSMFWNTDSGRVLGPLPGRQLAKIGWSHTNPKSGPAWVRGVSLGLEHDTRYVPMLSDYVRETLHKTACLGRVRPIFDDHRIRSTASHSANEATISQFFRRYGLLPDDYLAVQIRRHDMPALLVNPVVSHIIDVDTASLVPPTEPAPRQPLLAFLLRNIFTTLIFPILEETLCHTFPPLRVVLALYEELKLVAAGRPHAAVVDAVLHLIFQALPLRTAIIAHLAWNNGILTLRWIGAWARPVLYLPAPASLAEHFQFTLSEVALLAFVFSLTFCLQLAVLVIREVRHAGRPQQP